MTLQLLRNRDENVVSRIVKHLAELHFLIKGYIEELSDDCDEDFGEYVQALVSAKKLNEEQLLERTRFPKTNYPEHSVDVYQFGKKFRIHFQKMDFVDELRFRKLKLASQIADLLCNMQPRLGNFGANLNNFRLFLNAAYETLSTPRHFWTWRDQTNGAKLLHSMRIEVTAIEMLTFDLFFPQSEADAQARFLKKIAFKCMLFLEYLQNKVAAGYILDKRQAIASLQTLCAAGDSQEAINLINSLNFKNKVLRHQKSTFFAVVDVPTHSSDFYGLLTADIEILSEQCRSFQNNTITILRQAS